MKQQPLLSIRKLEAGYDALQILKGVDIELAAGDLAVVIGPNGSGKSTTVKSVFGLTTNFSGSILFENRDITSMPTHEIVRLGIGYVPQGRLVFDTLTVEENLRMGGYGLDGAMLTQGIDRVCSIFPQLRELLPRRASFLSGGQQQQLSIARALMKHPKLLLLDEPSLGLDPITQQLIFATLTKINKEGVTILMVEQNAHQALAICSKAFVIENGSVVASGGRALAKQKKVQALYLGGE